MKGVDGKLPRSRSDMPTARHEAAAGGALSREESRLRTAKTVTSA